MCETDFDCPGSLVCYRDVSWIGEGESECLCSAYYGWSGDNCEVRGVQTKLSIALCSIAAILAVLALLYNIGAVWRLLQIPEQRKWDISAATLTFTLLSLLGILGWRISTMAITLTPQAYILHIATTDEKVHPAVMAEKVFLGIAIVFTTLASLNVSLFWLEVAKKTAHLLNTDDSIWGGFRKQVYAFEFLFFIVIIVAAAKASTSLAALLSIPFLVVIGVTYGYGLRRMNNLIHQLDESIAISGALSSPTASAMNRSQSIVGLPPELHLDGNADNGQDPNTRASAASASPIPTTSMSLEDGNGGEPHKRPKSNNSAIEFITSMSNSVGSRVRNSMMAAKTKIRTRTVSLEKLTFKQRRERGGEYLHVLNKVRRTTFEMLFSGSCLLAVVAVYSIIGVSVGERQVCRPDSRACAPAVCSDISAFFLLGCIVAVEKDIYENTRTLSNRYKNKCQTDRERGRSGPSEPIKKPASPPGILQISPAELAPPARTSILRHPTNDAPPPLPTRKSKTRQVGGSSK